MAHITDKLYEKKWGVFTHYLYHAEDWSEKIASLDVNRIAETLHSVGAGYYFITLMQAQKYMIAPNATFDRIAGTAPGEACALRDLPLDLYDALNPYGIDLYLYYTGDGPFKDEIAGRRFGFFEPRNVGVTEPFVRRWAAVLEEYAVRYGKKVNGWWLDGCYRNYFKYNETLLRYYDEAVKRGNPEAVIAFNDGVKPVVTCDYAGIGDFTCGEFNDLAVVPPSRFIDGAQAHILAPLGVPPENEQWRVWCRPGCRHDREYVADYVRRVNKAGGVVTIDIKIYPDGSFDGEQIELLRYVGANV